MNLSTIRLILSTAKSSLATTTEIPCYTGYYMGDSVVTTDTYKVCGINVPMMKTPVLVAPEALELLDVFTDEHIQVFSYGNRIKFVTPSCAVFGNLMDSIQDFQIEEIGALLNEEFASYCKLSKQELVQLLDRLALFVSAYDKNGIYLTFTADGMQVESKQANSVELLHYKESVNFKPFTCCIDIEMFHSQVKSNVGDSVTLHYGEENAVKISDGNVTEIIALLEDDRVTAD